MDEFKYLRSTIQSNARCTRQVTGRIKGVEMSVGAICNKRIPTRVKGKVYKIVRDLL